jgi:hypothetical protein
VFKRLVIGAIVGAAVTWVYKDRISYSTDDVTRNVRERMAAALDAAAERVDSIANIVEEGLHEAARLISRRPRPALARDAVDTPGKLS